jgi:hypothetical protein
VLSGHAPPSLPKPEPEPVAIVELPPPTETLFALKNLKWREGDRVRVGTQFEDVTLPIPLAQRARRCGACVPTNDPRRKTLRDARGGYHEP